VGDRSKGTNYCGFDPDLHFAGPGSSMITDPPFSASTPDTMPGDLAQVEFIMKDSKPPVGHDAKCGAACHDLAASKEYIFTHIPKGKSPSGAPLLDSSIRKQVSVIRSLQSA
jgi:hypothetical protein